LDFLGLPPEACERAEDAWSLPLPLLDLVTTGFRAIRAAEKFGRSAVMLDEDGSDTVLMFLREGKHVLVHSPFLERTGRVSMTALRRAWVQFASAVVQAYCSRHPHEVASTVGAFLWACSDAPDTREAPWITRDFDEHLEHFARLDVSEVWLFARRFNGTPPQLGCATIPGWAPRGVRRVRRPGRPRARCS
jgi:hypothetical protein